MESTSASSTGCRSKRHKKPGRTSRAVNYQVAMTDHFLEMAQWGDRGSSPKASCHQRFYIRWQGRTKYGINNIKTGIFKGSSMRNRKKGDHLLRRGELEALAVQLSEFPRLSILLRMCHGPEGGRGGWGSSLMRSLFFIDNLTLSNPNFALCWKHSTLQQDFFFSWLKSANIWQSSKTSLSLQSDGLHLPDQERVNRCRSPQRWNWIQLLVLEQANLSLSTFDPMLCEGYRGLWLAGINYDRPPVTSTSASSPVLWIEHARPTASSPPENLKSIVGGRAHLKRSLAPS